MQLNINLLETLTYANIHKGNRYSECKAKESSFNESSLFILLLHFSDNSINIDKI